MLTLREAHAMRSTFAVLMDASSALFGMQPLVSMCYRGGIHYSSSIAPMSPTLELYTPSTLIQCVAPGWSRLVVQRIFTWLSA